MLTGAGLDQVWHHSRAHRLFTNARWVNIQPRGSCLVGTVGVSITG
jgi:hypothetical protein